MASTRWIYPKNVKVDPNAYVGSVGAYVVMEPTNSELPTKEVQIYLRDSNGTLKLVERLFVPGNNLEMEYFWENYKTVKFLIHRDHMPDYVKLLEIWPSFPKK